MNLTALLGLAILVFASTNIDDIFVLVSFFAEGRLRTENIVVGQYAGIGALLIVSLGASLISLFLNPAYIGLLGVLPILIGIKRLVELRGNAKETMPPGEPRSGAYGQIALVAAVTIANGGDNLGVYAPLFATQSASEISVMAVVFMAMIALWIAIAYRLVTHPRVGTPIRRYGHIAVPFVLVGLGLYIFYGADSFFLPTPL
jgi:cadmium resistance protein CadD (predicted permease)